MFLLLHPGIEAYLSRKFLAWCQFLTAPRQKDPGVAAVISLPDKKKVADKQ
jgi:hypothetical protein